MGQRITLRLLGLIVITGLLGGCAQKFTRENFEMIRAGSDTKEDVRQILGKPEKAMTDVWFYSNFNNDVTAEVFFDDSGTVVSKQWADASAGEIHGSDPWSDPPPQGEVREEHTRTRRIDK